jgi:ribosomal protein L7Ae-like RNA K-turn-binding protein
MWLSAKRDVVNTAMAKASFAKAARRKLDVPADLADRLEALLRRRCLDILGLARRAGQVVSGYEKVRAALKAGDGTVLLAALDAGKDGIGKIGALAPGLPVVRVLTAQDMGAAFGRDHTVHGLLLRGRLAERFLIETARLAGIAGADPMVSAQERE